MKRLAIAALLIVATIGGVAVAQTAEPVTFTAECVLEGTTATCVGEIPAPTTAPPTTTEPPVTTVPPTTTPPTTVPPTTVPPTTQPPVTTVPPVTGEFTAGRFDTAADLDAFDWQLHATEPVLESWEGEHNHACEGPTTHRTIDGARRVGDHDARTLPVVYWCEPGGPGTGHVMTSVDTLSVATISFSPKQTFTDVTRVCFDVNMNNLGEGRWAGLFVVPASDVAANGGGLDYHAGTVEPDFDTTARGMPVGGVGLTFLRGTALVHEGRGHGNSAVEIYETWAAWDDNMEPTSGPRRQICLTDNGNGTLTLDKYQPKNPDCLGTQSDWWRPPCHHTFPGALPDGEVKVILQDAAYDPVKHAGVPNTTWHWDNLIVE